MHGKMYTSDPKWELVKGLDTHERREVMKGVFRLLHSLGLKKRTWRVPKKLLHTEWFSASHCIPLSFPQQSNSMDSWSSAQLVPLNVMGYEHDEEKKMGRRIRIFHSDC